MKSLAAKASWLGLAYLFLNIPLFAQLYPMPSSSPVPCSVTGCNPSMNLTTAPYSAPIIRHRGRYLDSTANRDVQSPIRTYRAYRAAIVPEHDRIYMKIGQTFASYRLSTFFAKDLDGPMIAAKNNREYPEKHLPFLDSVYPERDSKWVTGPADGQERLGEGFDWDDRGYVYLPYTIFGWGVYKDGGQLEFVKQYYEGELGERPHSVIVVKDGARYYALLNKKGSPSSLVADVTDPANAKYVRTVPLDIGHFAKVELGGRQVTAIVDDSTGEIKIYSASALVTGAAPEKVIPSSAGRLFTSVTSDGSRFYAVEGAGTATSRIAVIAPSGSAVSTFLATWTEVPGGSLYPIRVTYSDGTVATVGVSGGMRVNVFRVAGDTLQHVDLGPSIRDYYSGLRRDGVWLHAYPGECTIPDTAVVRKEGGKEYLLLGMRGLGDVYEIQASDGVGIELDQGSWGTPNSFSAGSGGPFYGDALSFTTTSTATPVSVAVDFGNPEAGGANNTTVTTGGGLSHRYSGLTTSSAIKATKKVKITATADSSKTAEAAVVMQVPLARIGVKSSSLLFIQPNASATAPLLYGQQFVDASDGSVESHYASWTLDGVETNLLPNQGIDVGPCSDAAHAITLTSRYGYYDSSFAPRNNPDFTASVANLSYVVRPLTSRIGVKSSDATGVTYQPITQVGVGAIAGDLAAAASFTWELLDSAGATLRAAPGTAALGSGPAFKVLTSELVAGNQVRLTVELSPALIVPLSCQSGGMERAGQTIQLKVPDPAIAKATGECMYVGSPCTITASSPGGQDRSLWTYTWYLNEVQKSSGTGEAHASFQPAPTLVGPYTARVDVRNEAGITAVSNTVSFTLDTPLCSGKPTEDISIQYQGATSGCTSGCTASESIKFSTYAWGYTFQDCDQFSWNFGDGKTSTERAPTHKYAANGTYTVTLAVTNNAPGTNPLPVTLNLVLGTAPPPPPPPPPPCTAPSQYIGFAYAGPGSSCSAAPGAPPCVTNERVTFVPQNYPSTTFQQCDNFSWKFGDGTSSSAKNPAKTWTAPGTYRVELTVSNTAGSATTATDITVVQGSSGDPACAAPKANTYLTYQGLSSGCTNSMTPCNPGETIRFTARLWPSGEFQACDRFDWSFGDGSAPVTSSTSKTVDRIFAGAQLEYTVSLTVKNTAGSMTTTEKIAFAGEPIDKPTSVDFSWSGTTAVIGAPVTFTATATAPPTHPVTNWAWTFGEGPTATGNPVTYTFSTEGTWNVTLTASNAGGSAPPVTKQIKVLAANAFTYMLPVVAHLPGANGSQWRTDLQIYNGNAVEGPVELELELTNVQGMKKTFNLTPSTLILEDFMSFFRDDDWAGPVIIRGAAAHDLQIWTRTYSVEPSGIGTYGHLIPAVRIDGDQGFTVGDTTLYLTGVSSTDKYRTNIYLLNITPQTMPVTITAYEGQMGAAVGQFSRNVEPFQLTPISASTIEGAPTTRPFSLSIKGTSNGLIAYESVVDNDSNDPIYIPAISTGALADPTMRNQVLPSVGHAGAWRSDVTVFNPDDQAVQFDLSFYKDSTGELLAEAKDQILPAKGLLQIDDIIWSHSMVPQITTDAIGTLRVNVDSPLAERFPVVAQRNYSDAGDRKRFGQGILGFAAAKANVGAGKPAILPAVRSDQLYRSNIGLVNVGATEASVLLTLLDASSGQPIATYPLTLGPNQSRIVVDALPNAFLQAADRGSIKVEVTNDASVWAFASIIDRATNDPEYVPAIPLD